MATPPFALQTTIPGDSDIASQFPASERINRDVIQSWILANHDVNGNHLQAIFPWQSSVVATPGSSLIAVYADAAGRLKIVYPDGSIGFVGTPPGSIMFTAMKAAISTPPVGWLFPDGSAVSRSTYADLFAQIGTDFGAGDGSTTFNLPDAIGRVLAHADPSSTRLSFNSLGNTPIVGQSGGLGLVSILQANLPALSLAITGTITVTSGRSDYQINSAGNNNYASGGAGISPQSSTGNVTSTGTPNNIAAQTGGSGTGLVNVQPTLIVRALIKV